MDRNETPAWARNHIRTGADFTTKKLNLCSSNMILTGVNGNVIMSGCGDGIDAFRQGLHELGHLEGREILSLLSDMQTEGSIAFLGSQPSWYTSRRT
jgi:hypothetical protein